MKNGVMGVLIGAAAVVLATWYLTRNRGQLLPSAALFNGGGANGCGCADTRNRGYQAAPVRGSGQPPLVIGGQFQ